ncbi:MAG: ImmA/IrrE family metallo-endopeptidase [Bacillota bacterium]
MSNKIPIQPPILEWAIRESGMPAEIAYDKFPNLAKWMNESNQPTFIQLKELSNFLKVPFGLFFLKEPPKEDSFSVEFRTIKNKSHNKLSKNLKDTIIDMDLRKNWMKEYRIKEGVSAVNFLESFNYHDSEETVANKLQILLNLKPNWQLKYKNAYDSFSYIRDTIENNGVLVMMNGIVGNNTQRNLDVSEFRAFALNDDFAPLIFINRKDTDNGLLFSLIHEFIHIWMREDDIFCNDDDIDNIEQKVNSYTSEFLVSRFFVLREFDPRANAFGEISRIAKRLNVSTSVVAIKAYQLDLIDKNTMEEIIQNANYYFERTKENREEKHEGGDFYNNTMSRLSKEFYCTVILQAESGNIRFTDAYRLLGLKSNTYNEFKKRVEGKIYG